jgi:hypothetical protein
MDGLVVLPALTNRFLYDQDVYAAYVTYERPFGDLTALGGLRAEQVNIRTNQITSVQKDDNRLLPPLSVAAHRLRLNQTPEPQRPITASASSVPSRRT